MCKLGNNHRIKIQLVFLFIFAYVSFAFSQEDNLEVKGKIEADSLTIKGGSGTDSFPKTPVKGEVFYRTDEDKYYTYNGIQWRPLGGNDKYVATKIVAAYNSLGSVLSDGSVCPAQPGSGCNNPKADYTCDGWSDEQDINKAINDLGSNGGVVYLLEGAYGIGIPIGINSSQTALIGTGKGTVLVSMYPSVPAVIRVSEVHDVLISNLSINGNTDAVSAGSAIQFSNVSNSKITKTYLRDSTYLINFDLSNNNVVSENTLNIQTQITGKTAVYLNNSFNNTFTKNIIAADSGTGFYCLNQANSNLILDNLIQGTNQLGSFGIKVDNSSGNVFCRNSIQANYNGMVFSPNSNNNFICENNIDSNANIGMIIEGGNYNLISSNSITNNANGSSFDSGTGIRLLASVSGQNSNDNVITGNIIYNNGSGSSLHQIMLTSTSDNVFVSNNLVSFNTISDTNGQYGISINDARCMNNYLTGNNIIGGWTGYMQDISDGGNQTKYTDRKKITLEPLEPGGYSIDNGTLTFNGETSFVKLNEGTDIVLGGSGKKSIQSSKASGDLLILENISTFKVTVNSYEAGDENVWLFTPSVTLNQYDTLTLIGNYSCWMELSHSN